VSLFLTERGWNPFSGYWLFWLLTLGGVVGMYLVKWLGLHFAAWIFGQDELGDDYSFLVFTVNKMMGLLLLPSVIGIAFAEGRVWVVAFGLLDTDRWAFIISGIFDLSGGETSGGGESVPFFPVLGRV
jgi:hypothetical protein